MHLVAYQMLQLSAMTPMTLMMNRQVILIVFAVSSTFVGTAGLSIIANGVAYALGEVLVARPSGFLAEFYTHPPVVSIFSRLGLGHLKLVPARHTLLQHVATFELQNHFKPLFIVEILMFWDIGAWLNSGRLMETSAKKNTTF